MYPVRKCVPLFSRSRKNPEKISHPPSCPLSAPVCRSARRQKKHTSKEEKSECFFYRMIHGSEEGLRRTLDIVSCQERCEGLKDTRVKAIVDS